MTADKGRPQFGIIFPSHEIGNDPSMFVRWVREAETAGFDYIAIFDHVIGVDTTHRPGWSGPYALDDTFHEPFMMLSYFAAHCSIELMTSVIILPQRQAVLVAKQASELDLLTGGRFVLGVGTGWNELEYRALNVDFGARGRRFDEQLEVVRMLWTQPVANFRGEFHDLDDVGLRPIPLRKPIPLWLGGDPCGPVLRRVARTGDGWITRHRPEVVLPVWQQTLELADRSGRDPESIGLQAMIQWGRRPAGIDDDKREVERWLSGGARRISFSGLRAGRTPEQHIDYVAERAQVISAWK